ncbi:MAG: HlyD family efflux transporter periplasmic adaptor subunit [Phycisphaerales bacterium]|jgi:RND family efflux transporter MFP subunit
MTISQTTLPELDGPQPAPATGSPPEALRELRALLTKLLETQCGLVGGVCGVAFATAGTARQAGVLASFQADGHALLSPPLMARIERLAGEVAADQPPTLGRADAAALPRTGTMYGEEARVRLLATPLVAEGNTEGACVIVLPPGANAAPEALRILAASCAAFEAFLWRRQAMLEGEQKAILRQTLELLDASQQGQSAGSMGAIMCHELKLRFGCTRVSIGLFHRDIVRVAAISDVDNVVRTAPGVEPIESAMEECAAQDIEIIHPLPAALEADPSQRRVTRAHEELSRRFGPSSLLSLPLRVEGSMVGVLLLERPASDPFPPGAAALLRLVAETIGPALWTRRLADRGILAVTRDRALELGVILVGPRHTAAKLIGAIMAAVLIFATVVPVPSRVTANAEIRAETTRTVVPPFTGYLKSVEVKPGDVVTKGQVLATMDASEINLKLAESSNNLAAVTAQRDEALGKGDQIKARVLNSQILGARAGVTMFQDQVSRSEILSPIDGLVGKGDLDQFVRARVEPTQALFEIVSPTEKAVVYIDERDVQRVRPGQTGRLSVRALPGKTVGIKVIRVNPSADVVRGKNVYAADVEFTQAAPWLRPGMSATAKLDDGLTTTLAAVLRPIADELRMRLWW